MAHGSTEETSPGAPAAQPRGVAWFGLTRRQAEIGALLLTTTLAAVLHLANLGDHYLWQDEAQTALIAKTVMTGGLPRGTDGRNYFSQEAGREYGYDHIWRLHAWLQFYVVAGFFSVLGESELVARLPFALLGIATIPLCYYFARVLWHNRRAAALAALMLATSVPFLLLSRQCRYYSLTAFFSLLGLYAYCQLAQRKRWATPTFVVAAVLLFNSHYPCWAVLLATVLTHTLLFHRDRFVAVAMASLSTLVLNLPGLIWMWNPPVVGANLSNQPSTVRPFVLAALYFPKIFHYLFSPVLIGLLVVVGIVAAVRTKRFPLPSAVARQGTALLALFVVFDVLVFSVTTPAYFFRYLGPTIPVLCVLAGLVLDGALRLQPVLGIGGLAAILLLSPLPDFFYEITHHYRGPVEGIVKYLNQCGKPGDVVAITYDDLPVKFYTPLRVVGGLTGEDLAPAQHAKWVIIRNTLFSGAEVYVANYLQDHLRGQDYLARFLDYPDVPWDNRETPEDHLYRTASATDFPPIVILERLAP